MLKDVLSSYKFGKCNTVKELFEEVVIDLTNEIDNELIDIENDIESLSNKEIIDRIRDLRAKIY